MVTLGTQGEELARTYLIRQEYTILHRNWRCKWGEIDLVARDGKTIVFIEVKTRKSDRLGSPLEAVDRRKQERLRVLALHYINSTGQSAPSYRFDVVGVDLAQNKISLIKDAF